MMRAMGMRGIRFSFTLPTIAAMVLGVGCSTDPHTGSHSAPGPASSHATPNASSPTCSWNAQVVNHDGASGHEATVIGMTNVGSKTCLRPSVNAVWGTTTDEGRVDATKGSYFPIRAVGASVSPGDRVDFVLDSERLDDCAGASSRLVDRVAVHLATGEILRVSLGSRIEAGCHLGFGGVGSWV